MFIPKRIFPASLVVGVGLLVILRVVSAAEGPLAELVRAEGGVTVEGQQQVVGAALEEGNLVSVAGDGTAVVEYRDGCRYTVEGGEEYVVNHAQCICYEDLDKSKHSRHDAIAELGHIEGEAMVRERERSEYITRGVGTELKGGDQVMVKEGEDPEKSSALVEYYFGCDYTVKEGEFYTVDAEECCAALALPREEPPVALLAEEEAPAIIPGLALIPAVVAGVVGIGAAAEDDDDPPPVISPE